MTRRHLVHLICLVGAALAVLGARCGGPAPLRIWGPDNGSTLTWMPVTVDLDMTSAADLQTFQATLNGTDITDRFVLTPQGDRVRATAAHVWGPGLVQLGGNGFQASVVANGATHDVVAAFQTVGDPYADAVAAFAPGTRAGFGQNELPGVVLGPPHGLDLFEPGPPVELLSLGVGGVLTLAFADNAIVDGPGADFTVFENAFMRIDFLGFVGAPFSEPATVSVSQDGISWFAFPCADDPALDAPWYAGCAGVRPTLSDLDDPLSPHASIPTTASFQDLVGVAPEDVVVPAGAGGDSFDLADVGLAWARYVRIAASPVDAGLCCEDNAGSDIDAVAAVHSVPADDANGNGVPDAVE